MEIFIINSAPILHTISIIRISAGSYFHLIKPFLFRLVLVEYLVIEAIARQEFEDGLRMEVLPGGYWCYCGTLQIFIPYPLQYNPGVLFFKMEI